MIVLFCKNMNSLFITLIFVPPGRVRKYLDHTSTEYLVHTFISSRLDYCNSFLYGLPAEEILTNYRDYRILLTSYAPTRSLRSASKNLLRIPRSNLSAHGDRAFSIAAPRLWNQLPSHIRNSCPLVSFKSNLKTFLFKQAFC